MKAVARLQIIYSEIPLFIKALKALICMFNLMLLANHPLLVKAEFW